MLQKPALPAEVKLTFTALDWEAVGLIWIYPGSHDILELGCTGAYGGQISLKLEIKLFKA